MKAIDILSDDAFKKPSRLERSKCAVGAIGRYRLMDFAEPLPIGLGMNRKEIDTEDLFQGDCALLEVEAVCAAEIWNT